MDPYDSQYLDVCWLPLTTRQDPLRLTDLAVTAFSERTYITKTLVPEIIGFTVYIIIFGGFALSTLVFQSLIALSSSFSFNQPHVSVLSLQEQEEFTPCHCRWLLHCDFLL
jgi:hypothetical protein